MTTSGATRAGSSTSLRRSERRCRLPSRPEAPTWRRRPERPRRLCRWGRPSLYRPRSVRQADVGGKHVLVRADLNVPLEDGRVADDNRIRKALPTLQHLLEHDAKEVAVCSHLGRPKGPDPEFSMTPVARRLRELLPDERIDVL